MPDHDDVAAAQDDEDSEEFQDELTGYALGYVSGITAFWDLLMMHGLHYGQDIHDHCFQHIDQLVKWQAHGNDQPPPALPPFIPDAP